ncbi:MAG: hypothetical protein U1F41_09890 [Burkholderiales bacterium]
MSKPWNRAVRAAVAAGAVLAAASPALAACFAAGASLGACFVLLGPVPFVRGLGALALAAGLAGCALHLHLAGARPSAVLRLWRRRIVESVQAILAAAAGTPHATPGP